ncbi:MAG: hypothetical protein ABIB12_00945, partial [Patescibacteria group bacterium]
MHLGKPHRVALLKKKIEFFFTGMSENLGSMSERLEHAYNLASGGKKSSDTSVFSGSAGGNPPFKD